MRRTIAAAVALIGGCNEHVFRYVPDTCEAEQTAARQIPLAAAADILLVIDDSGSMCEEQENLARNFFDDACDVTRDGVLGSSDLSPGNIKPEWKNPDDEEVAQLAQRCGFIQILAAYDNDFRVGVITTDVSNCDNDAAQADGFERLDAGAIAVCGDRIDEGWGRRPQRGCLQAPPGATKKVFDRADADVAARFRSTLTNLGVYGSGIERGLDATRIFLSPDAERAPGCEGDLATFLRDDALLVVIYLTDEEDCSHEEERDDAGFPDERDGEKCMEPSGTLQAVAGLSCYPDAEGNAPALAPVAPYAEFLRGVKDDVRIAVIGGFTAGDDGAMHAGGCRIGADGAPDDQCRPSQGSSNIASICPPDDPTPCCVADPGTRYEQLADAFGAKARKDSICNASFRATMIEIAKFIAASDYIDVAEPVDDPAAVVVLLTRGDAAEPQMVPRLADADACARGDGWILVGDRRIQLCGTYRPKPGDSLEVHAREDRMVDGGCRVQSSRPPPPT